MPGSKEIQLSDLRVKSVPFITRILSLVSIRERGRKRRRKSEELKKLVSITGLSKVEF